MRMDSPDAHGTLSADVLHVQTTATGGDEVLSTWTVADDSTGYLSVQNFTSQATRFAPTLLGMGPEAATQPALSLVGQAAAASDTGTNPLVLIDGRRIGAAATVRPLFMVRNFGTNKLVLDTTGSLQVVGLQVNAPDGNVTMQPAGAAARFMLSTQLSPSTGDIPYWAGSANQSLAAGTSGTYLQTRGSGAAPVWAAAGGGSTGPAGATGTAGVAGAAGSTGPAGATGVGSNVRLFSWAIATPVIGGVPGPRVPQAMTCTRLDGYVVAATQVTLNIEERAAVGVTGTDIMASDLMLGTGGTFTTNFSNAGLALGSWLWVDISSVTGTVGYAELTLSATVD